MLTPPIRDTIVSFVQKEPRTIQEVAQHINKTWVTAESYVAKVERDTGLIRVKAFRKGTQGALKLVYYNYSEAAGSDAVRERLFGQIRTARFKHHFDFLEIYQYAAANTKHKRLIREENEASVDVIKLLKTASEQVLVFSGNLSLVSMRSGKENVLAVLESLCARGVRVKILCRVTLGSHANLKQLERLMTQYPALIEIRHTYQPLRGFIIDEKTVYAKDEENAGAYKPEELSETARIIYEVRDENWVRWLTTVFWSLWRTAYEANGRWKEIETLR